jgi:hypothetical protein
LQVEEFNASAAQLNVPEQVSSVVGLQLSLAKPKSASTTVGAAQDSKQQKVKHVLFRPIPCMDKRQTQQDLCGQPVQQG